MDDPSLVPAADTSNDGHYGAVALPYLERGYAPLPLPAGQKKSPPDGYTGAAGRFPDRRRVETWAEQYPSANVALRLPEGVIGIDVDAYGDKLGARTLTELESECGALPASPRSTSRPDDPVSGVRLYRLPDGCSSADMRDPGPGVEIIRHEHRYLLVEPSLHPEGRRYRWSSGQPPYVHELPELPAPWVERLTRGRARPATGSATFLADLPADQRDSAMSWYSNGIDAQLADLRAAHGWPEGHRDERGRGWEKLLADVALKLQRYAAAMGVDRGDLLRQYLDAAPHGGKVDGNWLVSKWHSQTAKAEALGPWPLPESFGQLASIFDGAPSAPSTMTPAEAPMHASPTEAMPATAVDRPADQRMLAHELVTRPEYRDRLRHADGIGWLAYDGRRYKVGAEKDALATVDRLLADMWAEIRSTATNEQIRELRGLQRASAMKGALTIAGSLAPYSVAVEDLDADPYLLNCSNGTLDLRTGEFRPHSPRDLITKVTRGAYHPGAGASGEWEAFLGRILPDEPVRSFLQRYVGSALVGRVREHVLAIWTGEGGNGKGTTDRALLFALGDYATVAQPRVLMREEGNEYDKVALRGARWVTMSETERDKKMAESTMKALTGGDVVQARIPYQLPMRFRPSHTLSLITNQLPTVSGDDSAVWRRIRVVPFDVTVPESEVIHDLDDRLELQADAVLAWAIEGYRAYSARGLDAPEHVMRATAEYREQSDDVANFIEECCEVGPHLSALATPLYQRYSSWATSQGLKPLSQTGFGKALSQKGYASNKAGHIVRVGLALRNGGGWS